MSGAFFFGSVSFGQTKEMNALRQLKHPVYNIPIFKRKTGLKMNLEQFLKKLNDQQNEIAFTETMATIEENYTFTPTTFTNGETKNKADTNNGSCKIFAFGLLNNLNEKQTLACFGDYYRQDVLQNPEGDDHQNIRNFMKSGWSGIIFEGEVLTAK